MADMIEEKQSNDKAHLQRQTIVYDIPKEWISLIKTGAAATVSGYMKQALREKPIKDGHIKI